MTDVPPGHPPKRLAGRPATRPDGRAITAAERQTRRRERMIDRAPALNALIGLALAGRTLDDLVTARDGRSSDPDLYAWYLSLFEAEQALRLALNRPDM